MRALVEYDATTALVVVDVQNDFADRKGSLYVTDGEAVVPFVNAEIARAGQGGALIVYTQDWHPESTPHFEKDGGMWPVHCVMDTWGAELHPDLEVAGQIVRKGSHGEDGYSGFTQRDPSSGHETPTALEDALRLRSIRRVVVAGLATDYCVKATVIDAANLGFETAVLGEGIRAVNLSATDGDRALEAMKQAGARIE